MGLVEGAVEIVFIAVLVLCMSSKHSIKKEPSQRVFADCCDPGLNQDTKEMCDVADNKKTDTIYRNNKEYVFTWTGCKEGEEPWRKYE